MQLTKHWAASLDDYVIGLSWAPDSSALAAASGAGPVSVFGAGAGQTVCAWAGHDPGTNSIAFGAPFVATGGQDGTVKLWDPRSGQHAATARLGTAWVEQVAWRPGKAGTPLLAASTGRKVSFVGADGAVRHTVAEASKTVSALTWHPGGGALAAASFGSVRLWDADDFILQKELPCASGIQALVWSPDGRWLVSGNNDPSVHLWTPETDLELHMSGYETKVKHLSFDPGSRWLATSGGTAACVWDCSGEGPEGRDPAMMPHDAPVCGVAFQSAGQLLATASDDGAVMLWTPGDPSPLRATIRLPSPASQLAWSPDDTLLAIGTAQGTIFVLRCGS